MKKLFLLGVLFGSTVMAQPADVVPAAPVKTSITSETLEMVSGQSENTFYFSKKVRVEGTNLRLTADQLVVTAQRAIDAPEIPSGALPAMGSIHKIVAVGNVHIYQEGREATAGKAEFFPKEGKVVLTENPRVIDAKAIVSGWRITMVHGERKVTVEQDPTKANVRPTVNLESLPDLGFEPKTQTPAGAPPSNAAGESNATSVEIGTPVSVLGVEPAKTSETKGK